MDIAKRALAILLCISMVMSLAACGKPASNEAIYPNEPKEEMLQANTLPVIESGGDEIDPTQSGKQEQQNTPPATEPSKGESAPTQSGKQEQQNTPPATEPSKGESAPTQPGKQEQQSTPPATEPSKGESAPTQPGKQEQENTPPATEPSKEESAPAQSENQQQENNAPVDSEEVGQDATDQMDREDKELVVELVGGQDGSDMTDEELDEAVDQLIQDAVEDSGVTNLGNSQVVEQPSMEEPADPDVYEEDGSMNTPFDQVYPDLIEQEQVSFSGESILIKMASDTLTAGLKAAGVGMLEKIVPLGDVAWYEAKLVAGTDAKEALAAVRELDEVLLAEYNYEVKVAALDEYDTFDQEKEEAFQNNSQYKAQWYFHHCGIVDGYEKMTTNGGDAGVVVAVIDSGVDYNHEDLKDNMWVNTGEISDNRIDDDKNGYIDDYYGVDIVAGSGSGDDTNGHGTHVAGIIAARNNNTGVVGIAYNVKIMSVKAAAHNGTLNQADIAKAIIYAYEMGAEVINMSFGGSTCSIAVQDALATAYTRCVLVASAGNDGRNNEPTPKDSTYLPNYPAALSYVLGVMSVDQYGVESAFTNWDVYGYNGVEYELYAPGENIMSTLPGNKYGYLSGTSMAAPVVSAFAAILRSEFADRDKYPSKFIYGQLASTSGVYADCLNPAVHGDHNIPQVANLYDALTKLPEPDLNVQDFAIFDDPKYSDKNNGDGVIDAGETIALGLTIRNRWGMSENTIVKIDTISGSSGMADPYFTIQNPEVNYGSVGTYSTQDCGKVYTDGMHTGWEKPFLITVSEDCPNDYLFTLNVTITCENGVDEADTETYTFKATENAINGTVRSGYILPSIIDEDMVLTADNLYIIPRPTVIQAGVTVRVEPGAHIQFWSDDANDPYADSNIAYLLVNGNLLVDGTKEDPVYIYPSQLMDHYGVEIGASATGYVSLKYADITNFFYYSSGNTGTRNYINLADHCTFRMNYNDNLRYRYLSGGKVQNVDAYSINIGEINAKDCVFYKVGYNGCTVWGAFERCIFTQCAIEYYETVSLNRCVFLGNSVKSQEKANQYYTSSLELAKLEIEAGDIQIYYRPETGVTYIGWSEGHLGFWTQTQRDRMAAYLKEVFGGGYFVAETMEEYNWVSQKVTNGRYVGIQSTPNGFTWSDGTPLQEDFLPLKVINGTQTALYLYKGQLYQDAIYNTLYEIPGQVLPEDITFDRYAVTMDTETTYQLQPRNTPIQLSLDSFLYESTDEAVITVSDTGLVTPVGNGTADVWVWSLDRAVKNRVTFTVKEYVALESITFPVEAVKLEVGKSVNISCDLLPANTTRNQVNYTSSDPNVVTIVNGVMTAVGKGTATITATCEGMSATMEVTTWVRATKLENTGSVYRKIESCDTSLPVLKVTPENADLQLQWSSRDESIVAVQNGKLVMKKTGYTYLDVTDLNSGVKTSVYISISADAPAINDDVIAAQLSQGSVALPEIILAAGAQAEPVLEVLDPAVAELQDGQIVLNGEGITSLRVTDPRNGLQDEIMVYIVDGEIPKIKEIFGSYSHYVLMEDGRLFKWGITSEHKDAELVSENVKAVSENAALLADNTIMPFVDYGYTPLVIPEEIVAVAIAGNYHHRDHWYQGEDRPMVGALLVLDENGEVYAIGTNTYGMLGIGTTDNTEQLTKVEFNEKVVQIVLNEYGIAYYLTESGCLYVSGGSSLKATKPVMIARNVTFLDDCGSKYVADNKIYRFAIDAKEPKLSNYDPAGGTMLDIMDGEYDYNLGLKDGGIYDYRGDVFMHHINTAIDALYCGTGTTPKFVVTEEGLLFSVNGERKDLMGMGSAGVAKRPLFMPVVQPEEQLTLLQTNLDEESVLHEDMLSLHFNKQLLNISAVIAENGTNMIVHQELDGEHLRINPAVGMVEGNTYTLTISASGTLGVTNVALTEDLVIEFTYQAPEEPAPEEDTETEETVIIPDAGDVFGSDQSTDEGAVIAYEAIIDNTVVRKLTADSVVDRINSYIAETQYNPNFSGNVILNPTATDTDVTHWLRVAAPSVAAGTYTELPLGSNWWGTANEELIEKQTLDYSDVLTYARLTYKPYLTEAPENTFPFVTSVKLFDKNGEEVTTVGNEEITFRVTFNRDMDTAIPLSVRFGSAYPYGDYEIAGAYTDARTWEGTYTLNTLIENGEQYFVIANGCSATDDLELQPDEGRFRFEIDTTAAQALIMQGTATNTGIELRWTQDDFDTLMGYNVYRSTKEDGLYTKLNKTVIPADTMSFFDDTVEPGTIYYYNFTVVKTDLNESEPSGKIIIMSKDTMAPDIYHSPVASAFTGANLVLSATVTDNLNIAYANLYYRVAGTEEWSTIRMNKLNDKYSAIIPASYVTVAGIEYYIEAFDGVSYTYKGSTEEPFAIVVQEAIDANSLGDVDMDGAITNQDALLVLYTINDKFIMTTEQFARADLDGDGYLHPNEALQILKYVSGAAGSLKM